VGGEVIEGTKETPVESTKGLGLWLKNYSPEVVLVELSGGDV
jgi:hypothetical protein